VTQKNDVTIYPNIGSDIRYELAFVDDDDQPIDMTGHTIEIFQAEAWGTSNGTVEWTDQAQGIALLSADWDDTPAAMPEETWFRIRTTRTSDNLDDAAPKLIVRWL